MKYRKKPVVIDAFQYGIEKYPSWFEQMDGWEECSIFLGIPYEHDINLIEIDTLEGKMKAFHGDYIIRGVKGELYPCKPDIFEMTYESLEDAE